MTDDPWGVLESRWAPWVFAIGATVLVGVTLLSEPATPLCLAAGAVTVAAVLLCSWLKVPRLNPLWAAIIIVGATVASSRASSVGLFVVVVVCGMVAGDGSFAVAIGELVLAIVSVSTGLAVSAGDTKVLDYIVWPLGFSLAWAGGLFVKTQVQLTASLRNQQEAVASEAAVNERRRLAREIHDVIAHSMTVTTLHVSGARLALQDDPPDVAGALDALVEAEQQGRQSLADIRRTVGLLAADEPEESQLATPLPGAADLAQLVRSYADAGAAVQLRSDGDLTGLSAATGLAVYRVVQEALANAARHAPGAPVDVEVRMCRGLPGLGALASLVGSPQGRIDVQVTNGAPTCPALEVLGGGRGLTGMAERVELLGGRLRSGPHGEGWQVCARLPVAASGVPVGGEVDVATSW